MAKAKCRSKLELSFPQIIKNFSFKTNLMLKKIGRGVTNSPYQSHFISHFPAKVVSCK